MKEITISKEMFAEVSENVKDETAKKFSDPMNKLFFTQGVELFVNEFIKKVFDERKGE